MEQNNEVKNKFVETYADDMAKVIQDDRGGGLVKKIIQKEEEHEKEKKGFSPGSIKNKLFILAGFLLVLSGSLILFYFFQKPKVPTVPLEKTFVPIIFNDKISLLKVEGLGREEIVKIILDEVTKMEVKNGGVGGIYLTNYKKMVGLRDFVKLMEINFVPGNANYISDNFLMGIVNNEAEIEKSPEELGAGRDFFILLKINSLADVFDSLRLWEKKMFSDLHEFFGFSLTPLTKYLLTKEFQDGIIENKNARILYDAEGKIAMMYILANDNSIVIAKTESALREIIVRLASSRIKE